MIFIVLSAIDNIRVNMYILWGLLGASDFIIILNYDFKKVNKASDDKERRICKKEAEMIWRTKPCAAIAYAFAKIERTSECIAVVYVVNVGKWQHSRECNS